jgi:hypothetical protein
MSGDPQDYEVGYKKPPVATRFQTGDGRGNRKGRLKNSANFKTDLKEELAETITLKVNGRPQKMSKQRAMIKTLVINAIKGGDRAIGKTCDLQIRLGLDDEQERAEALSPEDQAILDAVLNRGSDDGQ